MWLCRSLYRAYQKLYASMHEKGLGPHKTQYRRDENYSKYEFQQKYENSCCELTKSFLLLCNDFSSSMLGHTRF